MIMEPGRLLDLFTPHTDLIIFHIEATANPSALIMRIREAGRQVGLAVNPETPVETLLPWLPYMDEVLVMAVDPGFAGGRFLPSVVGKVRRLRREINRLDRVILIEVDGAVNARTARKMVRAGADRFVGGTSGLFREGLLEQNARDLLAAIDGHLPGRSSLGKDGVSEPSTNEPIRPVTGEVLR